MRFDSSEDMVAKWAVFMADPHWQAVRSASEEDGPIVASINRRVLNPTAPPAAAGAPDDRLPLLPAALLRPTEVGPKWRAADRQPVPDSAAAAVCGGPGVVAQLPVARRVATALTSGVGEVMQETLPRPDRRQGGRLTPPA